MEMAKVKGYDEEALDDLKDAAKRLEENKKSRRRMEKMVKPFGAAAAMATPVPDEDDIESELDIQERASAMVQHLAENEPELVDLVDSLGSKLNPSLRRALEQASRPARQGTPVPSQLVAQAATPDASRLTMAQERVSILKDTVTRVVARLDLCAGGFGDYRAALLVQIRNHVAVVAAGLQGLRSAASPRPRMLFPPVL